MGGFGNDYLASGPGSGQSRPQRGQCPGAGSVPPKMTARGPWGRTADCGAAAFLLLQRAIARVTTMLSATEQTAISMSALNTVQKTDGSPIAR